MVHRRCLYPWSKYILMKLIGFCNNTDLEKKVLDCGAGGNRLHLTMFYEQGYKTKGIEISDKSLT